MPDLETGTREDHRWTRRSFAYLIGYLSAGGVGLLAAPELSLRLLGATHEYSGSLARLLGGFMVALALTVAQIARNRVEALYRTTLAVRAVLLAVLAFLYIDDKDPLFAVLFGIVGVGVMLTAAGFVADRR